MKPAFYAAGISLFPSDLKQLGLLVRRLAAQGLRVKRAYLIRVLAHSVSERDMLAASVRRHAAKVKLRQEAVAMNANVRILQPDVDKLFSVEDALQEQGIEYSHTEVLRAMWFHPPATPVLVEAVKDFAKKFPDGRRKP